jgi:endogenous inhibitor of DNA gyrase (YacG/DUF329 family)
MRCPICDKDFERAQSPAAPFCSDRCRSIDLGRWLGEVYALPTECAGSESDDIATEPKTSTRTGNAAGDD